MKKYAIGIDLGGRSVKFGLFTEEGELIQKSNIVTRVEDDGKYILPDIYHHLVKIFEKYNLSDDLVVGIGIGVPGAVSKDRSYVKTGVNLGWKGKDVGGFFAEKFKIKVLVENDANVAALGEQWQGAAKGYDNLVMLTLGTGVGGGIIANGQIISGHTGAAGEIGHMPILQEPLNRKCGCGNDRCFELVASATGLEYLANEMLFSCDCPTSLREVDSVLAKDILDAFKEGDVLAKQIVEEYFSYLGRGCAIIGSVVDPQAYVFGGGVSNAGQVLLDGVQKYFRQMCYPTMKDAEFKLAELGNDAGIYGAAKLVL